MKESLEMDDQKTYHDCLVEIRRKSINVETERKRNTHQRRGNNSNSSNNSNSNRNSRANNLKKKMGDHYVDPNKWKKMSKQERDAHVKKHVKLGEEEVTIVSNQMQHRIINHPPLAYQLNTHRKSTI